MSTANPAFPYVYQPFGSVTHPALAEMGRLYGVIGMADQPAVSGLTKSEAEALCRYYQRELTDALIKRALS